MSKTSEELLFAYKKANKQRRITILTNSGFADESSYLASLMGSDTVTKSSAAAAALFKFNKKEEPKIVIHNVHILDASGSMHGAKLQNAVQGINEEIRELQKDNTVIYTQTLVDFSGSGDIRTTVYKTPIANCQPYSCESRGMTALNQAVGETLERLRKDTPPEEKVLVKIFTDGGENASKGQYAFSKDLAEYIKECESKGFTITFVGTTFDVNTVVRTLNIHASNTLSHDNTSRGVAGAFAATGSATMAYVRNLKSKKNVSKNFYSKQLGKLDEDGK